MPEKITMNKAELNAHWALPDETLRDSYTITHKREREAFVKGWHKAVELCCEWLEENIEKYIYITGEYDGYKMFEDFKKAMKE